MKMVFKTLILAGLLSCILVLEHSDMGLTFIREAQAVVGAPLTPVSAAGVARRTTRRVVVATTATASASASAASANAAAASAAAQPPAQAAPAPPPAAAAQTAPAPQAAAPASQSTPDPQTAAPPPEQPTAKTASAVPVGTVVQALPADCRSVVSGDVNYSDCGGVFYKAAFQGNNLVYVVVEKPLP